MPSFYDCRFRPTPDDAFICAVWFERDRKHVSLTTPAGRTVVDLWDDDVDDAVESGYLTVPRHPRPSDADWQPHVLAYARSTGLL